MAFPRYKRPNIAITEVGTIRSGSNVPMPSILAASVMNAKDPANKAVLVDEFSNGFTHKLKSYFNLFFEINTIPLAIHQKAKPCNAQPVALVGALDQSGNVCDDEAPVVVEAHPA